MYNFGGLLQAERFPLKPQWIVGGLEYMRDIEESVRRILARHVAGRFPPRITPCLDGAFSRFPPRTHCLDGAFGFINSMVDRSWLFLMRGRWRTYL